MAKYGHTSGLILCRSLTTYEPEKLVLAGGWLGRGGGNWGGRSSSTGTAMVRPKTGVFSEDALLLRPVTAKGFDGVGEHTGTFHLLGCSSATVLSFLFHGAASGVVVGGDICGGRVFPFVPAGRVTCIGILPVEGGVVDSSPGSLVRLGSWNFGGDIPGEKAGGDTGADEPEENCRPHDEFELPVSELFS